MTSNNVLLREPTLADQDGFLYAMNRSQSLHDPWVKAPLTAAEYIDYFQRSQKDNQKCFLAFGAHHTLVGVFNISEIVRGCFQSAYLVFYAVADYAAQGYMKNGLKLLLNKAFYEIGLHRLEANIQPDNHRSIHLVKNIGFRYEGFSPRYLKIKDRWCGHERWAMTEEDFTKDDPEISKQDAIDLLPYDPQWPQRANEEINTLRSVFSNDHIVDIQHVGSTAIPGLMAKPVIDIQISVRSLDAMKILAIPVLQKLGYEYWDKNPDTERMFFVKGMPPYGVQRTHHVHIVEYGSDQWDKKIIFRDYLRNHPDLAEEYEAIKMRLAQENRFDREKYTEQKTEFVNKILKLAQTDDR